MDDVVPEFLAAARAFRSALGSEEKLEQREFARRVRNALARVYLTAAMVPESAPLTDDVPDSTRDRQHSRRLEERIRTRLGDANDFVDVWDPTGLVDDDRRPIESSLSQVLVEIDEDIADAASWLEDEVPDALWQVRWEFENHWGKHAVDTLRPLHLIATYGVG